MTKQVDLFRSEEKRAAYFKAYDLALAQMPLACETTYVDTYLARTHIIHCGKTGNPRLVMLHCMGFSSICWYKNLEALSQHFDVYCIDSVGEPGRTESYRTKITKDDYNQWLLEVLDALHLGKVNLVGWSFGGFLATGFAMTYPERIDKVVAMSPGGTISPIATVFFLKLFPALFSGNDKRINQFLKWISGSDNTDYPNPAFAVFLEGMKSFKGWATGTKLSVYSDEEFRRLEVPYLLLIGDKDPIYKRGLHHHLVDKFNGLNPRISSELISGTHGFPIQQAEVTNKKLISFLLNMVDRA